jgi:prepilin-type N-terminal cleavage/methylation domain-containing protein
MRREDGFTLIELLAALAIGTVVLLAAFGLLDSAVGLQGRVAERVDAIQRARQTMDIVTRDLRSQVCPDPLTPALISASDRSVDFYVDLGDGSATSPLERRTITFDPVANQLTEAVYVATGTPGAWTFPTSPTRTDTLLTNVVQDGATAVFRYYTFDTSLTPATPTLELTGGPALTANDRARVVRIAVDFLTRGSSAPSTTDQAAALQDDVYLRAADPNDNSPVTQCPLT